MERGFEDTGEHCVPLYSNYHPVGGGDEHCGIKKLRGINEPRGMNLVE